MEEIILIITVVGLFLDIGFIGICIAEDKTPYEVYKNWLSNKNWFGKFYTVIPIIITFPSVVLYYVIGFISMLFMSIYTYGLKDKEK